MSSKWALQNNLIAKIVKGNEPNNLTTISEMTKNFLPKQELSSTTISRVLFWTSKVAFWRPDLTDVNTCAVYSHCREWLPVGVRDLKNVARARSDWPSGVFPWECVNIVMTLRYFAFRAPLITQARIEKGFWVENSTSLLYLPIPSSAETWKIFTKTFCLRLRDWWELIF